MKKVEKILFETFDGLTFESEKAAKDYEDENVHKRLASLSAEQFKAAITYADPDLSDALEYAGRLCEEARKAAGVYRRKRSNGDAAEAPAGEQSEAA